AHRYRRPVRWRSVLIQNREQTHAGPPQHGRAERERHVIEIGALRHSNISKRDPGDGYRAKEGQRTRGGEWNVPRPLTYRSRHLDENTAEVGPGMRANRLERDTCPEMITLKEAEI